MIRRAVITGYGTISSLDHLSHGMNFYDQLFSADTCSAISSASVRRVEDSSFTPWVDERQFRRTDRFSKMALAASQKALSSANFAIAPHNRERTGMVFNTCFGPLQTTETYMQKFVEHGPKKAPPALFPYTVLNAFTGLIAISTGAVGSNSTISGASAFCYGLDLIRQGKDDAMLVGGCEELTFSLISRFEKLSRQSQSSQLNGGMVLGEGAAVLMLESYEASETRCREPLAEVLDYGSSNAICYSKGPYSIDSRVIERAMWQALERSGVEPSEISLLGTGANGVSGLQEAEEEALFNVFGESARPVRVNTKKILGETFGASESFAVITMACALGKSFQSKTVSARSPNTALAMINCYEFGGNVRSIIMRRSNS